MNLLKAVVSRGSRGPILTSGGSEIAVLPGSSGAPIDAAASQTDGLQVGIRAEDFSLHEPGGTGIPGRVRLREVIGDGVLLTVDSGSYRLRVLARTGEGAKEGDALTLRPRSDRLHFFNVASGIRLESLVAT